MNAEFSSEDDVLNIPVPDMIYTSPLALVALPSLPPPPAPPPSAPAARSGGLAFVRRVSLAAVAVVCVLATTARAGAPVRHAERQMLTFHVDDHRPTAKTKHEYARTALVPSARRRR